MLGYGVSRPLPATSQPEDEAKASTLCKDDSRVPAADLCGASIHELQWKRREPLRCASCGSSLLTPAQITPESQIKVELEGKTLLLRVILELKFFWRKTSCALDHRDALMKGQRFLNASHEDGCSLH